VQQSVLPTIGFLIVASHEAFGAYVTAFRQGLGQVGYFEGRNVSIEFRWARGQYDRLSTLASELVGQRVAIIAANGGARSALAAKAATTNIPIVFTFGDGDPVANGLVRSFNEPGGNVTGITMIAGLLESKRLEILRELVRGLSLVYLLINPNNAGVVHDLPSVIGAAGPLGIKLEVVKASTENEIQPRAVACATTDEVRNGRQSDDCKDTRHRSSTIPPGSCRRGDRVTEICCAA
jgi:putative tryptophan/tyrosine transport system substrate-binding protein